MAKLVKQIHDLVDLAINQGISDYFSRSQIDDAIDSGQMMLWRQLLKEFVRTKRIRNDLLPFQKKASVTITALIGSLPSDFEHEIEAWVTVSSVNYPVLFKEAGFYRRALLDPVDVHSTTNLFATIYNDTGKKIEISDQITPVVLVYFKRPIKPTYATTVSGGQLVYDDTNSVDVEWAPSLHDIIVENALAPLGLNMLNGMIVRAGQKVEPKEMTL